MKRLRVGVVFGGRSGEHEVSLVSAQTILKGLDRSKYQVTPILITPEGHWRIHGRPFALAPEPAARPRFDVMFPVLHGTYGEDGTIQGLFEMAGLPYVGAGVLGSAAGMDKDVMKRLFRDARLPIVDHCVVRRGEWHAAPERTAREILRRLRYPIFVKPANLGSSVGISKVHNRAELAPAMRLAGRFDTKIVVEQGVEARELECSVLGNETPEASLPGEILPGREFYDYQAKYADTGSRTLIPAVLPARQRQEIQKLAIRAFQATECEGLARVDFFLERATGRVWVNEINTMPGFTSISMYPKMWEASGVPLPRLLDGLIRLALERAQVRGRLRRAR